MIADKEIKALVSLVNDEDQTIIAQIEEKILSIGGAVIPYLEREWEHNPSPVVQRRIEGLVHTLQYEQVRNRLAMWYANDSHDLLTGMWIIATYQYPDIKLKKLAQDIDLIYQDIQHEFQADLYPFNQVKAINSILFDKLKFGANSKNFHSPGNSMINITLQTRKGNPITLSVIYLLIAQKLKLPIYGVNLPNLFILTYKNDTHKQFYINVFNQGIIFSRKDIENYIAELHVTPQNSFFEPCNSTAIIRRALRNLIASFEKMGEHVKANEIKILLVDVVGGTI